MLNETQSVIQNLIDAGCNDEFIERFLAMDEKSQKKEMIDMLSRQRSRLLDNVHADERRIYCLDYLVKKLKNE